MVSLLRKKKRKRKCESRRGTIGKKKGQRE
jgi:hypothetical protein